LPIVTINGQEIELAENERLNAIQAAQRVGENIPHYCWHPGLSVVASCRMCLVETGHKDPETGDINMVPKLVPGCQTPATDGTVFVTNSEKVRAARAMVEEDLLIRHPIDCPICDKAGECYLQDYHFEYGQDERRADLKPFTSRKRPMGDTVTLFVDRCVMCTRCVRFTREITGTSELMVVNRGAHEEIDVFPGYPLENKMSGNVVDLCPVGALGDQDFLYSQRVWFMKQHDGVCAGCSTGCSISIEENQDRVYRLKPRENPHVNQWWMCDEGRYGYQHVHDPGRLKNPRFVNAEGNYENTEWSDLPGQLDDALKKTGRLAAVVSPYLTVEEAYLLCKYIRSIDEQALFAIGTVPIVGEDETFPNGFTIRAEKCPNRKGVEAVVASFSGALVSIDDLAPRLKSESVRGLWISGGYKKSDWVTPAVQQAIDAVETLIVQDMFASPAMDVASFQLPGVAFAERAGSYVNHGDRLQTFDWAVRPPAGAMSAGQLLWRLLGEQGLFNPPRVLGEVAREIAYFAAASGAVPAVGIDLKVNQMVGA
jgi:NADH-quinone oxidoreductase subunit G